MEQSFKVFFHLYKGAEVRGLGHRSSHHSANGVGLGNVTNPGILFHLLESKSNPLTVLVHFENHSMDLFALLDLFRRMDNLTGPGHIADMQETVDAIFQFNERTVVGEVSHLATDVVPDRIFLSNDLPGIHLDLLHSETDFLLILLDLQDNHFDLLPLLDNLFRVGDATGPGHLGHVNESFDPLFQFDERTVREHVDDLTCDFGSDRKTVLDVIPRTRLSLLQTE